MTRTMTSADRPWRALSTNDYHEWWLGLFSRLDAALPDDLTAIAPATRRATIAEVWASQPSELGDGPPPANHAGLVAAHRRYTRLLALFAGRAGVDDDHDDAAAAGRVLVAELSRAPSTWAPQDGIYSG